MPLTANDENQSPSEIDSPTKLDTDLSGHSMPAEPPDVKIQPLGHHMKMRAASSIINANPKYTLLTYASPSLPKGFFDAVKDTRWKEAMEKEISTLQTNKTWVLV